MMQKIKDTIDSVMQRIRTKSQGTGVDSISAILKKNLTKSELRHIKLNYFNKGVLYVNVDSSSWLYKINLQKRDLLNKVNQSDIVIKDIRFRIGDTK